MSGQDCEQLTFSLGDSPASPSPWLESRREGGMIVTSGRRCCELSENCARVALSVKTYLESSALPPGRWLGIWSVQAITSSCLILRLRLSELGTDDQGYSSPASQMWPTPTARDCKGANSLKHLTQPKTPGNNHHVRQLANAVKLFATPCARDYRTGQRKRYENPARANNINDQAGGQLNPTWVEWLMGFPLGWTDLNASEMR